jgi:hypothetical protein
MLDTISPMHVVPSTIVALMPLIPSTVVASKSTTPFAGLAPF